MLWGGAGFFAIFASGCLGWLLIGRISVFTGTVLVPSGWILGPAGTVFGSPGLHSESVVSLWGEPATPGARQIDKLEKVEKRHDLGCQLGVFWDTF